MAVRYLFENYTFDPDRRELRRGAELARSRVGQFSDAWWRPWADAVFSAPSFYRSVAVREYR
jgi:hypothetical protein